MKKCLALLAFAIVLIQRASAGSAVAWGPHGHLVYSYGHPVQIPEQRALEMARSKDGLNVRIIAATDTAGYGAIAVAIHPNIRTSSRALSRSEQTRNLPAMTSSNESLQPEKDSRRRCARILISPETPFTALLKNWRLFGEPLSRVIRGCPPELERSISLRNASLNCSRLVDQFQ